MEENSSWDDPTDRSGEESCNLPTRECSFSFGLCPNKAKRSKSSFSSVTAPGGTEDGPSILVGYAFGTKKMSTMSIIMAEASQVAEDNAWDEPTLNSSCSSSFLAAVSKEGNSTMRDMEKIRVSFVPVDLNFPLEEQHGGNFDAILHKLTEDILLSMSGNSSIAIPSDSEGLGSEKSSQILREQAAARLNRLVRYKTERPSCCLVDPPERIRIVLSRAEIANELSKCLVGVTTKSGMPVSTPNFFVCAESDIKSLPTCLEERSFRFPLISKPLTAAGTPESHKMIIFLNSKGLLKAVQAPCLLQQYANHDSILYKVYVLGDEVYVFQRPSLPNLPSGKNSSDELSYVAFDSQQPYPDLSVFSAVEKGEHIVSNNEMSTHHWENKRPKIASPSKASFLIGSHCITADEINPVVRALQQTFCLGLFGFDVIITHERGWVEMLVIDVNYFPSYKEVDNFPKLLTQYLARYAVNSKLQSSIR
mmetsp:Transcript_28159/g.40330  ORF Transcript_28159/g.40330 Transcript_28159/m.40330 type:complete len:478 (-) Transcript_28159:155-1588(-)|eukprot:CAMPEP_0172433846 /NCGR_PEP_ID=MMETSP1064-20121228/69889_1 /TAXON_ID=202472 /ORGANISM="Aulacoseira subarctica , Strain CCAP 1002/5" /LENGTH=477 /DNA_ID=CAMNT_0013181983 /DNA_START=86 /DNA_END=1519 /DNA_ORIENTATION=+